MYAENQQIKITNAMMPCCHDAQRLEREVDSKEIPTAPMALMSVRFIVSGCDVWYKGWAQNGHI